jgi:stage V sporulation protein SpoVS
MSRVPETEAASRKSKDGISVNPAIIKRAIESDHRTFIQSTVIAHQFTAHTGITLHFIPANPQKESLS